jgi:hypothetical protein
MACVNHPEVAEVAQCAQCAKPLCQNCMVTLEGRPLCGPCKQQVVRKVERGDTLDTSGRGPSPWEEKRSLGSLFRTIKLALLSPNEFFGSLRLDGKGFWSYLIVLGWPSAALGAILGRVTGLDGVETQPGQEAFMMGAMVGATIFAPIGLMFGIVIGGAILHLFLRMFGAANAKLETTIRTYVYAQSIMVISWIPVLGPLVNVVWMPIVLVIGLKRMHNTSYGKVIAAICVPLAVLIGLMIFAIVTVLMAKQKMAGA